MASTDRGGLAARPWLWAALGLAIVVAIGVAVATRQSPGSGPASPSSPQTGSVTVSASPEPSQSSEPASSSPTAPAAGSSSPAPTAGQDTRPTAPPVGLESPATPTSGVEVTLGSIESVEGEASLPGEVAGPALRVTVDVHNGTGAALDLAGLVTNLYYGADRTPAVELGGPGAVPMPSEVAAGEDASGTYVFNVPTEARDRVVIEVDLSVGSSVVLFEGPVR